MQLFQTGLLDAEAVSALFDDPILARLIVETIKRKSALQEQQMQQVLQLQGQPQQKETIPTQVPNKLGVGGK
jgi:acetyl/propionyl-CoA carboxylase alpha subunit